MRDRITPDSLPDNAITTPLELESIVWDGQGQVRLIGELDGASVPLIETRLQDLVKAGRAVTLDFSALRYCDSQGISLFFRVAKLADAHGGSLTLAHPRGLVSRVFDIVDIAAAVPVIDDARTDAFGEQQTPQQARPE